MSLGIQAKIIRPVFYGEELSLPLSLFIYELGWTQIDFQRKLVALLQMLSWPNPMWRWSCHISDMYFNEDCKFSLFQSLIINVIYHRMWYITSKMRLSPKKKLKITCNNHIIWAWLTFCHTSSPLFLCLCNRRGILAVVSAQSLL